MKHLDELQQLVDDEGDIYGLVCFLVRPEGTTLEYTRLIDVDILKEGAPEVLQFYGDDIMIAFQREVKE